MTPFASLRDALFLARHEVRYMLGRRETLLWTFAMPIVFFYFIGTITGGLGRGGDAKDPIAVRAPADAGFLADQLIRRLEDRGYRIVRPSDQDFPRYGRRLTLPAGFTDAVLARRPVHVRFDRKGSGPGSNYDEIRISRAVYSVLADLIVLAEKKDDATPEAFARLAAAPRPLTMEVERAGERKKIPSGFEQAVPGTMVNFILLVLFTTGGVLIVNERNLGLLRRLASAPISRGAVVLGKWMARMTLGMIQIAFGMLTGTLLFHVDWGHHLPTLIAVLLCYGALGAALGMVLGNIARTDAQVIGFGVVATNVMAALGGCWWPIEITPDWAQKLAIVFPTGWAMDALHRLMSFGYGPASVIPHMAGMIAAALVAAFIAARTFRFQ
jgi:ABC-2 type transport system permease protein